MYLGSAGAQDWTTGTDAEVEARTCPRNSAAMPTAHILMLYLDMEYATPAILNQRGSIARGGLRFSTWALLDWSKSDEKQDRQKHVESMKH